jgi:hypothetical protein
MTLEIINNINPINFITLETGSKHLQSQANKLEEKENSNQPVSGEGLASEFMSLKESLCPTQNLDTESFQ